MKELYIYAPLLCLSCTFTSLSSHETFLGFYCSMKTTIRGAHLFLTECGAFPMLA